MKSLTIIVVCPKDTDATDIFDRVSIDLGFDVNDPNVRRTPDGEQKLVYWQDLDLDRNSNLDVDDLSRSLSGYFKMYQVFIIEKNHNLKWHHKWGWLVGIIATASAAIIPIVISKLT